MLTLLASAGSSPSAMQDLAIVLAVAGLAVLAMGRFGVAAIPAFLIAGAVSGPYALGLIHSPDTLTTISELAIILLLFGIGLHLDIKEIRQGSSWMFAAGIVATVVCIIVLWPIAKLWGLSWSGAFAVAAAMSLSSTALVTRRLMKQRALRLPAGRLSVIVLIAQDLAVPLLLVVISLMDRSAVVEGEAATETMSLGSMLLYAALSLLGLGTLALVGRWLLPRVLKQAAAIGSDEVLLTLGLAAAIGFAIITHVLGFSYELGAFLAGLLLGSTPFKLQLGALLSPARDLFLAVFFTTLGMAIDPGALTSVWPAVLAAAVVLAVVKALAIGFSCWASGATGPLATTAGLTVAQAGEFSLVLLQAAFASALISKDQTSAAVAVVVISLVIAPLPIMAAAWLEQLASRLPRAPWLSTPKPAPRETSSEPSPNRTVIIAGFGPVGQVAAEALEWMDVNLTIIELNPATVHTHNALGRRVYFGDVARQEVLEAAGVRHASAIILTIPDERAVMSACQLAKALNPDIRVIARFPFLGKGLLAKSLGADEIVVDEVATATAMQKLVAEYLKLPTPAVEPPLDPHA